MSVPAHSRRHQVHPRKSQTHMSHYNVCRHPRAWWAICAAALLATACATPQAIRPEAHAATTPMEPVASQPSNTTPATEPATTPPRPVPVRDDAPLRYVVKKGDTLWDIAGYFLNDPWYWPELWYSNPQIDNPHLIYPGDVLELVWVDGRPRLRRAQTVRLQPQVRELPIKTAIPTIPLDAIRQFLDGPRLVTPEQLNSAPYIVQFFDGHLMGGDDTRIYVRNAAPEDGPLYAVVRAGQIYRQPGSDEILGYEAIPVGSARITEFGKVDTGVLTDTVIEALEGDRLLPVEHDAALASDFYPHAPDRPVSGRIIATLHDIGQVGQYQIVVMNLGTSQGIERGHVLGIYRTGRHARDPITGEMLLLPPLQTGVLMVFKAEDRISYGLVMIAERPIHEGDAVRRPQAD